MCQLLGMNANTPTDVMFSFTGFATRAEEHKDGFGIAFFEDKGVRLFVDTYSARESPVAEMVRRYPIKSENIVAHIARPPRAGWRWRTPIRSCASSGAATGCSPTTAT
jgi:glutamine amidotransferase